MGEIKKIALKGALLFIGLIALNFIYKVTLWQSDLEQYSGLTEEIENTKSADILYLGDCSDSYFGSENEHEKGISHLLDSLLPNVKVATISETGFHAGMFASILNNIPEESSIKTVIVTMNLRSFAAYVQYTFITNSINQRLIMLDNDYPPLLNRFFLILNKAPHYSGTELEKMKLKHWKNDLLINAPYNNLYDWKTAYENGEFVQFDNSWTTKLRTKGAAHIANYAFQINAKTNPRTPDFDNIVAISKKRNWKLIFHLLPENSKTTQQLVGEDLTLIVNDNRKLLKQRYHKSGVIIIDNMELLSSNEFIEEGPNSHFHYLGRKLMAEKIKQELK